MSKCWCDSGKQAADCCKPILRGDYPAATAEALMRSRYSAFVTQNSAYLRKSWHPATCPATINLDPDQRWLGLTVTSTRLGGAEDSEGEVSFVARYKLAGQGHRLQENSSFSKVGGHWVYVGRVLE